VWEKVRSPGMFMWRLGIFPRSTTKLYSVPNGLVCSIYVSLKHSLLLIKFFFYCRGIQFFPTCVCFNIKTIRINKTFRLCGFNKRFFRWLCWFFFGMCLYCLDWSVLNSSSLCINSCVFLFQRHIHNSRINVPNICKIHKFYLINKFLL
jgi:hypothetical protein